MNLKIEEFENEVLDSAYQAFKIEMPYGAKILSAVFSGAKVTIFAEIDTDESRIKPREFAIIKTGYSLLAGDNLGWMFLCTGHEKPHRHAYVRII